MLAHDTEILKSTDHIAIFTHGGIAPPGSTMDVPSLTGLVRRLAREFHITLYTVLQPDGYHKPFQCGKANVKFINAHEHDHIATVVLRTLQEFRKDHALKPYSLVHGLWALPGGLAAVLAARLAGLTSVVSMLGGEAACLPEIGYGNMRRLGSRMGTLWTCRHADALTFLTHYQLDGLRKFTFERDRDVHVIPMGAEDTFLLSEAAKHTAPPYNFVHIGHLNKVKDQRTLLKAFQTISTHIDCRLRIAGEDTLAGTLQQYARDLGIADRVTFLGLVPHSELREHLDWAHVLLHSSLYEGEGVVFAEAASRGVLLCGTRVGLLSDLGNSCGVVVEAGDHEELAREVLRLLADEDLRNALVSRARKWARDHTADWTASRFAELYRRYLKHPSRAAIAGNPHVPETVDAL